MRRGTESTGHLATALAALLLLGAPLWAWGEQKPATTEGGSAAASDTATISGLVRVAQFGARGETVRVYIDAEEAPVLVSRRDKGKELLALVGATVRASGYLRKIRSDEGFKQTIDVTEFVVEAPPAKTPRKAVDHGISDD